LVAPPKEIKAKETKDRSMATTYAAIDLPTYPEDAQIIQRDGWYQIITPSFKEISANEVFVSHIKDEEIEKRVEETFALYRKDDLPFKWSIGPMSSPDRLEQKVAKRASESWIFRGMAIDTDTTLDLPAGITVESVDSSNFEEFLETTIAGWNLENFREQTRDRLMKSITHPSCEYYLARKSGQSIGAGGTVFKQKHGFLISAVVLKEHRGSGAYRALVQKRLVDMQKRGLPFAVTQARDSTSAPVLERLGFETVFRAKIYRTD
jgi:N-acetylglutamate synthase-like GNAT family acetyltransferase